MFSGSLPQEKAQPAATAMISIMAMAAIARTQLKIIPFSRLSDLVGLETGGLHPERLYQTKK